MHKRRSKKGVITIFSAISFALTVSLFLSLLESARIQGMKYFYPEYVNLQSDNILAHYNVDIYEKFGIFGRYNDGNMEETLNEYLNRDEKLDERDLLKGKSAKVTDLKLKLMTDDDGEAFQHLAASYMKAIFPDVFSEKVNEFLSNFNEVSEYMDGNKLMEHIDAAIDAVLKAIAIARSRLYKTYIDADGNEVTQEDPEMRAAIERLEGCGIIEAKEQIEHFSILSLLPEGSMVSKGRKIRYDPIERRELKSGDMEPVSTDRTEYYLTLLYAGSTLRSFLDGHTEVSDGEELKGNYKGLIYELEYLCAGTDSDEENLSYAAKRVYILRSAIRFLANLMDPSKVDTAYGLAVMLVGFTGLPFLIPLVKLGILICWSLVDAISDCRMLFSGIRLPLIPYGAFTAIQLNYPEHLLFTLVPKGSRVLSYRIMDMIEESSGKKMDDMVIALCGNVEVYTDFKIARALLMVPIPKVRLSNNYEYYSKYYR